MADDLVLSARVQVDVSSLERDLARGVAATRTFSTQVSTAMAAGFKAPKVDVPAFQKQGAEAAAALSGGMAQKLRDDRSRFKATGKDVGKAVGDGVEEGIADAIDPKAISKALKSRGASFEQIGKELTIGVTAPLAGLGFAAFRFSTQFETALSGVRKTTNLTGANLAALGAQLRALSEEPGRPGAAQLADLAALGAQLGITQTALLDFTRTTSALDIATDLNAEEAATALARLANITQLPQQQIANLGSTLVALGNAGASTEREITNLALRLAGAGAQIGLTNADILGVASALANVGIEAEAGGTAFSRVFAALGSAVGKGGAELRQFSAVAGLSMEQFRELFKNNPAEAVTEFVEGLGQAAKSGQNVFGLLESLNFDDARLRDALLRTAGAGHDMRDQIERAGIAFRDNTALAAEFGAASQTTAAKLQALVNSAANLSGEFGDALLPILRDTVAIAQGIVPPIRTAVQAFAALPEPIRLAAVGAAALAAAAGPLLFVVGSVAQSMVALRVASLLATPALTAAGTAAGGAAAAVGLLESVLLPGSAVLVGLGLLATATFKAGEAAREAKRQTEAFYASLQTQSSTELAAEASRLTAEYNTLLAAQKRIEDNRKLSLRAKETTGSDRVFLNGNSFDLAELDRGAKRVEQRITEVLDRMTKVSQQRLTNVMSNFTLPAPRIDPPPPIVLDVDPKTAEKALKAFLDKAESSAIRLDVLVDLGADPTLQAAAVDELRHQYDLVTAAVKAQGGPQQAAVDSLRTQNRLAKELADHYAKAAADAAKAARNAVPAPTVTPEQIQIDQTLGSAKSALVEVFIPAKVRLDRAALTGDADAIRAAQQELKGATTLLEGAQAALAQRLAGSALSIQQQRAVLDAWAKAMQDAGLGAESVLAPLSKLDTAATAARGVLQIADAFDRVDESTRRALDGIIGVLDGVSQARKALSGIKDAGIGDLFGSAAGLSSVVAIVGGVASLISALNKPSPITVALDSNRQALDRLSAEVNAMRPSLANLTRVGGQAQTVALDPSLLERGFLGAVGGVLDGAALARQLASLGTSFGELQAIAEQFNITLQDSKGRALQQGFADLADVMTILREKALTLGDGFSDLQDQFNVRADLFNLDTPADAWDEAVAEAAKLLPPSIAKQFAAIDIDTKAGQDAARALIQRLFTQGTNGQLLDVLKASGFESISDFFSFLQFAEDPLDQLGTAAERAAQALNDVNLPPGFRKGLAEWASTAPNLSQLVDTIQTAPVQPYTPPTSYVPPTQQRPGDTNGGRQRPADSSQPIHIERVDVYGVTDVDSLLTKLRQRVTNEVRAQGGAKSASQVGPGLAI